MIVVAITAGSFALAKGWGVLALVIPIVIAGPLGAESIWGGNGRTVRRTEDRPRWRRSSSCPIGLRQSFARALRPRQLDT